jgi:preprotein translocase subunit YajC
VPELVSLLPLIAIALLFWLLLIRPTAKRQKAIARMQGALAVGDEVMLSSGIFGRVTSTEGEHLQVQVADGVVLTVARGAVGTLVAPDTTSANDTAGTDSAAATDAPVEEN